MIWLYDMIFTILISLFILCLFKVTSSTLLEMFLSLLISLILIMLTQVDSFWSYIFSNSIFIHYGQHSYFIYLIYTPLYTFFDFYENFTDFDDEYFWNEIRIFCIFFIITLFTLCLSKNQKNQKRGILYINTYKKAVLYTFIVFIILLLLMSY